MLHFFGSDSAFRSVPYGRVCPALSACANSDCQLHQSASFLIEWARIVAGLGEAVERLPNLWIVRSDLFRNN